MQVRDEDENESGSGSMQEDEKWGFCGIGDGFCVLYLKTKVGDNG